MRIDVNQSPKALIRMPVFGNALECDHTVSSLIGLMHSSTELPASSRCRERTSSASASVQKGTPVPELFAFMFAFLTRSTCCSMTDFQVWEEEWWFDRSPETWVTGSVTNSTVVGVGSGYWQSRPFFVHWKQAGRAWSHLTCYLLLVQCGLFCSM